MNREKMVNELKTVPGVLNVTEKDNKLVIHTVYGGMLANSKELVSALLEEKQGENIEIAYYERVNRQRFIEKSVAELPYVIKTVCGEIEGEPNTFSLIVAVDVTEIETYDVPSEWKASSDKLVQSILNNDLMDVLRTIVPVPKVKVSIVKYGRV